MSKFPRSEVTGLYVLRQNIDRKPPTLLRHFLLSHSSPGLIYPLPTNLYLLPRVGTTTFTLVTSPPLRTFEISPVTLLSGRADSLRLLAAGSDERPREKSKISQFVRTPAGRGVAVTRTDGVETWSVTDNGTNLTPIDSWSSTDLVVVMDGGKWTSVRVGPFQLSPCHRKARCNVFRRH